MMHILQLNKLINAKETNNTERYESIVLIDVVTIFADERNFRYGKHSIEFKNQLMRIVSDKEIYTSDISGYYMTLFGQSLPNCELLGAQHYGIESTSMEYFISLNSNGVTDNYLSTSITLDAEGFTLIHGIRDYLGLQLDFEQMINYSNARCGTTRRTGELLLASSKYSKSPFVGIPYSLPHGTTYHHKVRDFLTNEFSSVLIQIEDVTGDLLHVNKNGVAAQDRCFVPACDDAIFLLISYLTIMRQVPFISNYVDPDISGIIRCHAEDYYAELYEAIIMWLDIYSNDDSSSLDNSFIISGGIADEK